MSLWTRIVGREPAAADRKVAAQERLAQDVERRKLLVGDPYAKRRAAALKGLGA